MTAPGTTVSRDGQLVVVGIAGRATGAAVGALRSVLEEALDRGERFTVLFDRSRLTAATADGRAELERWSQELTPRLGHGCLAWADLYDERRAASLARAAATQGESALPYPHRTFGDVAEARRWLATFAPAAEPPPDR